MHANQTASEVAGLLSSWSYEVTNIIEPGVAHEQIRVAKAQLDGVRYNFERVRWSSAETEITIDERLRKHGHADLIHP